MKVMLLHSIIICFSIGVFQTNSLKSLGSTEKQVERPILDKRSRLHLAPVASCKDITIQLGADGTASITAADLDNGSLDFGGGLTLSKRTFDSSDIGDNTVILAVKNGLGEVDKCEATVTVEDYGIKPTEVGGLPLERSTKRENLPGVKHLKASNRGHRDSTTVAAPPVVFNCARLGTSRISFELTDHHREHRPKTEVVSLAVVDKDNNGIADFCESLPVFPAISFSPNGDAVNDSWVIENIEHFPNNRVSIFNRKDEPVFETSNYQNDWDGTWITEKGFSCVPVGLYKYVIVLPDQDLPPQQGWVYVKY